MKFLPTGIGVFIGIAAPCLQSNRVMASILPWPGRVPRRILYFIAVRVRVMPFATIHLKRFGEVVLPSGLFAILPRRHVPTDPPTGRRPAATDLSCICPRPGSNLPPDPICICRIRALVMKTS